LLKKSSRLCERSNVGVKENNNFEIYAFRDLPKKGLTMKKKDKEKKKADMPEFTFKEFTPEESKIYEEAISKFREAIAAGKNLRQAYESYPIADQELRSLIQVDFLKILIAERHFAQQQPLEKIARELDAPLELLMDTHARMLQEVGMTAADHFAQQTREAPPETND
jgi:hypothetical protein